MPTGKDHARDADAELVEAWNRSGDREALGELARRYGGLVRRAAAAALGRSAFADPGLVEDAAQETFVRLIDGFRSFRGEGSVPAFIAGVARRAGLDELRKAARSFAKKKRASLLLVADEAEGGDPANDAIQAIEAEGLLALLCGLEEPDRSLVYLRDAEGIGIAELAGIFKLPEGTVKSKVSRARAWLREAWEGGQGWTGTKN